MLPMMCCHHLPVLTFDTSEMSENQTKQGFTKFYATTIGHPILTFDTLPHHKPVFKTIETDHLPGLKHTHAHTHLPVANLNVEDTWSQEDIWCAACL